METNTSSLISSLEAKLRVLAAKDEIRDVLTRYCRAIDRLDMELLLSCYHADAYDDHMPFVKGTREEFATFALENAKIDLTLSFYVVGQALIEVNGNCARVESYCISAKELREAEADGSKIMRISGMRSLDHFDCRDGVWRISSRKLIPEWGFFESVPTETVGRFKPPTESGRLWKRDRTDPSYTF